MKISFTPQPKQESQISIYLINNPDNFSFLSENADILDTVKLLCSENKNFCKNYYLVDKEKKKEIVFIGFKKNISFNECNFVAQKILEYIKNNCQDSMFVDISSNLIFSDNKNKEQKEIVFEIAKELLFSDYNFDKYKTKKDDIKNVNAFFVVKEAEDLEKEFEYQKMLSNGVFLARDLVHEPANVLTPLKYLQRIQEELEPLGVVIEFFDKVKMEGMGMNALLGVAQGSENDPFVVIMHWNGSDKNINNNVVLLGKGVTFDSGGLSLKPANSMETMKTDMGGSAAVVGAIKSLALRKSKANVTGIIGLVENMPSGTAQRPGDIVKSLSGKTIEVMNTDAEGRLVLADILWYAGEKFKPAVMIDLATLTGAAVVALGYGYAALFGNDANLVAQIKESSEETKEFVWELPLPDSYDKYIDSKIADVRNTSTMSGGGTITAAKFLQRFVPEGVKWAHIDIASVAFTTVDWLFSSPKGATGFGVRLLDSFIKKNYE